MGFARTIAYSTVVQVIGKFIASGLSLIVIVFLTRYLGVAGYGDYTIAVAFVAFFAVFADLGTNLIVVREISKDEERAPNIIANVLALRIIFSLVILLLAPVVAIFLPYSHSVKLSILILALGTYLITLNQVFVGIFQSKLKLDRAVFTDILGRIVILIVTLLFIRLHFSLLYMILAISLGNLITLTISWILVGKIIKIGLKFDFVFWKKIFIESLPLGAVLVLGLIYHRIDAILLSVLKGSYDVGIYGASFKLFEFLILVPGLFAGTVFPLLSKFFVEKERFYQMIQKSFDVLIMAGFPTAIGGVILAPYIINLIAGPGYESSILVFKLLSLSLIFIFMSLLSGTTIVSIGKQNRLLLPYLAIVIFNIGVNLVLIPRYSYLGTASTVILTEFLVLIFGYYILYKEIHLFPKLSILLKSILSTFFMAMFLLIFTRFNLVINWAHFQDLGGILRFSGLLGLILLATILYLFVLYLLKGYTKSTLIALLSKEEK